MGKLEYDIAVNRHLNVRLDLESAILKQYKQKFEEAAKIKDPEERKQRIEGLEQEQKDQFQAIREIFEEGDRRAAEHHLQEP